MALIVVGIDPGVSGFAAELEEIPANDGGPGLGGGSFKAVRCIPIPTLPLEGQRRTYDRTGITRLTRDWERMGVALVVIEKQQVFPKMGSFAGYLKGLGYGYLTMALSMVGIPVEELPPSQWKRELGIALGGSSAMIKTRSIEKAGALFPGVELRDLESKPGARVACHDKCEAMLLAEMAYRLAKRGARV